MKNKGLLAPLALFALTACSEPVCDSVNGKMKNIEECKQKTAETFKDVRECIKSVGLEHVLNPIWIETDGSLHCRNMRRMGGAEVRSVCVDEKTDKLILQSSKEESTVLYDSVDGKKFGCRMPMMKFDPWISQVLSPKEEHILRSGEKLHSILPPPYVMGLDRSYKHQLPKYDFLGMCGHVSESEQLEHIYLLLNDFNQQCYKTFTSPCTKMNDGRVLCKQDR